MEEKLGEGALSGNVEEHKEFIPALEGLEEWCKKVQKGEVEYDGKVFLGMVESFSDAMVAHMTHVRPYLHSFLVTIDPFSTGTINLGPQYHARKVYISRTQSHR